jgi:hypothetical protein
VRELKYVSTSQVARTHGVTPRCVAQLAVGGKFVDVVNGQLDEENLHSGARIPGAKIADDAINVDRIARLGAPRVYNSAPSRLPIKRRQRSPSIPSGSTLMASVARVHHTSGTSLDVEVSGNSSPELSIAWIGPPSTSS